MMSKGPDCQSRNKAIPLSRAETGSSLSRQHWRQSLRFQLPVLGLLVMLLQVAALYLATGTIDLQATFWVSIFATLCSNWAGVLIFRQTQRIPGTRRLGFILPALTACYAAIIVIAFAFRVPYSVLLVVTGYFGALVILWILNYRQRTTANGPLYFISSEQTDQLARDVPHLAFETLKDPLALGKLNEGAVVVDLRHSLTPDWEREIANAVLRGVPIYHVKQAYESLTGKVSFDHLSENQFGSLIPSLSYLAIKRFVDIAVSFASLVLLFFPMIFVGIAIRLTSPGPAIFKHPRIGYRGKAFHAYKFRTMQQIARDESDLDSQITLENDPRITPLGKVLRETRLDELPQLFNVLAGQMSLIGPRPEARALASWYEDHLDFYAYRHVVRPGITGWAQINQGHVTSLEDIHHKTQYDFFYIKNLSPSLDFLIALKTLEVMLWRRGAR